MDMRKPIEAGSLSSCAGSAPLPPAGPASQAGPWQLPSLQCTESLPSLQEAFHGCVRSSASVLKRDQCPSPEATGGDSHWSQDADVAGTGGGAAAGRLCRQRSVTPLDDAYGASNQKAAGGSGPQHGGGTAALGPITPAAASSLASQSPRPASASAILASPDGRAAVGAEALVAQGAAALWARLHSFMQVVAASPLIQSALVFLEANGTHPLAATGVLPQGEALHWTLAQMLALYVRAGYSQATESVLLALLWVLESSESVWRSPATTCLADYLKHLALVSPEAVVKLTVDWTSSFRQLRQLVVDAQMDLLFKLDWRVQLDWATEVKPCYELLFRLPVVGNQPQGEAGCATPPFGQPTPCPGMTSRHDWTLRLHTMCTAISRQALLAGNLQALHAAQKARAGGAAAAQQEDAIDPYWATPAKRPRVMP